MLKPGENLRYITMTKEQPVAQIKVDSFKIKVSLEESRPSQAKGENLTARARKLASVTAFYC